MIPTRPSKFVLLLSTLFVLLSSCSDDAEKPAPSNNDCTGTNCVDTDMSVANNQNNANNMNNANNFADMGEDAAEPDMASGMCQIDGCETGLVCNTSTGMCQECEFSEECGNNATCGGDGRCVCDEDYHFCGDTCVDSTAVETCGDRCDACPAPAGGTALCESQTCTGECSGNAVLDPDTNACVGCVNNSDCSDPLNSVCDNGTCTGCSDNAGCTHLSSTPICDVDVSRCVECTSDADCGGNSCNLATGQCTQTTIGSVDNCEPCVANSECRTGFDCVPMFYDGQVRNTAYCLRVKGTDCPDLAFQTDITRANVSSMTQETYCGINESLSTCEAIFDYGSPCASDSECGAMGLDDGLCTEMLEFEFGSKCSYECTSTDECPMGITGGVSVCLAVSEGVSVCGGV